jgi:hypothetical protein
MKSRLYYGAAFVLLFCSVVLFTGCSGGGSSAQSEVISSPESAVVKILDSWRATSDMNFGYDDSGKILAQEETGNETSGYIEFKDLSGEVWRFTVLKVEYESEDIARVFTSYYYSGSPQFGGLDIVFRMVKDQDTWFLDGLEITEIPAVVVTGTGINGAITDKVSGEPVSGARVELYSSTDDQLVGYAVTDSGGYYEIMDISAGTYYLVVSRDGYAPYTISGIQVS